MRWSSEFPYAWLKTNSSSSFTTRFCGKGAIPDIAVSVINETQALHRDLRVCSFDRGFHSPEQPSATRRNARPQCAAAQGSAFSGRARARASASISPRPGVSTRRSSRQSTTLSIAVSTGCAPTAPMGLHTPSALSILAANLHRIGLLVRRRMREAERRRRRRSCLSAAISCGFRPPRSAHRDGNGLRCPAVGNAGRFDAKRRSVVPVRWVAWLQTSPNVWRFVADFARKWGFSGSH